MKKENSVSPVIGVILMVAITVILAAVISAFIFGMASSINHESVKIKIMKKTPVDSETFFITYMDSAYFIENQKVETKYWLDLEEGHIYNVTFEGGLMIPNHEILPVCDLNIAPDYCYPEKE